jgi:SAM-dependent methyltransferase
MSISPENHQKIVGLPTTLPSDSQGGPGPLVPHGTEIREAANRGFEPLYQQGHPEQLPWHWEGLDPDFARALAKINLSRGRVVDLGSGAGTQAVAMAQRGFDVWATDFSSAAMRCAAQRSSEAGLSVACMVDDVCNTRLNGPFDLVLDRGCLHVIAPAQRLAYRDSISRILAPGGYLFLKCFSVDEPPRPGPWRFSEEDILQLLGSAYERIDGWSTEFHGTRVPYPRAIFVILRRVP